MHAFEGEKGEGFMCNENPKRSLSQVVWFWVVVYKFDIFTCCWGSSSWPPLGSVSLVVLGELSSIEGDRLLATPMLTTVVSSLTTTAAVVWSFLPPPDDGTLGLSGCWMLMTAGCSWEEAPLRLPMSFMVGGSGCTTDWGGGGGSCGGAIETEVVFCSKPSPVLCDGLGCFLLVGVVPELLVTLVVTVFDFWRKIKI